MCVLGALSRCAIYRLGALRTYQAGSQHGCQPKEDPTLTRTIVSFTLQLFTEH
jgi:hypothetical protein